ncbi:aflatoxin regulatory protein-domain-containing protein [Xylariaceae sp. FL1272]|nr:aflatoxin regulatory protein-domain-containing protein [Xylariaceae sp. FL1272]
MSDGAPTIPSPSPSIPAPAPAPAHNGSKLRDSCLACSSSKVRCPREKPTCSRCVKRKLPCKYLTSKRAGRKHESSGTNNLMTMQHSPTLERMPMPMPMSNPLSLPTSLGTSAPSTTAMSTSPAPATSIANDSTNFLLSPHLLESDIFSDFMIPTNALNLFANVDSTGHHDMDTLLSPLTSIPSTVDFDAPWTGLLDSTTPLHGTPNLPQHLESSPGALDGNLFGLSSTSQQSHNAGAETRTITNEPSVEGSSTTAESSECDCAAHTAHLMKQLFVHPKTPSDRPASSHDPLSIPSVSAIIERNRSSMDTANSVMSCPCSKDPHMLAVMSHIVSKILAWYVAAIQGAQSTLDDTPSNHSINEAGGDSTTTQTSTRVNSIGGSARRSSSTLYLKHEHAHWETEAADSDPGRAAAQLVLGELHLAQRLVTDLIAKFKSQQFPHESAGLTGFPPNDVNESLLLPLSAEILDLLANNLKDQLKTLSVGIVNRLKHS